MAYSELIKNFNRTRDYMREFFVYGFKSRNEYLRKSSRTYDNERRRIESWLGDYMRFYQTPEGKNVFLSLDSRTLHHNPLYTAWKAKSFTDGDITLHFILFDILYSPDITLSLKEIAKSVDNYLLSFDRPRIFDISTIRKKLNEYIKEGIIVAEKHGRTMYYRRNNSTDFCNPDILNFFSEIAPCGVIGSYLLDKQEVHDQYFAFKHHYITGAMDSEITCSLLLAISKKREITLETINRDKNKISESHVIPLRIMISVQNGRQYLMSYVPRFKRITSFRIDNIASVKLNGFSERFAELRAKLDGMMSHMWGVSTQGASKERLEHVEFTVKYTNEEKHIHERLEREKRCGTVEIVDENTSRFSADVFDANELVPWIRTFICRITDLKISNEQLENQFIQDLQEMYALYGLAGDDKE